MPLDLIPNYDEWKLDNGYGDDDEVCEECGEPSEDEICERCLEKQKELDEIICKS